MMLPSTDRLRNAPAHRSRFTNKYVIYNTLAAVQNILKHSELVNNILP